jgi:hypothetical protein
LKARNRGDTLVLHLVALEPDIAAVIKQHRDEFESEDELRSWFDQDHVEYDERTWALALGQLEFAAH